MSDLQQAILFTPSELLDQKSFPKHVNLRELDTKTCKELFNDPRCEDIISLSTSRQTTTDEILSVLSSSIRFNQLRWLDFTMCESVTIIGVDEICKAVQEKRLFLKWLSLVGTAYDATPYTEGQPLNGKDYWRLPQQGYDLAKVYGYQDWLVYGCPNPESPDVHYIDIENFPPSRFLFDTQKTL